MQIRSAWPTGPQGDVQRGERERRITDYIEKTDRMRGKENEQHSTVPGEYLLL